MDRSGAIGTVRCTQSAVAHWLHTGRRRADLRSKGRCGFKSRGAGRCAMYSSYQSVALFDIVF